MHKQFKIGLMAVIALWVSIAQAQNPSSEIVIGWIGPLTGNCAIVGVDSVRAVELAIDEVNSQGGINGKRIRLVVEDDAYDTQKSLSAYAKLTSVDKPAAIFLSTYGAVFALGARPVKDQVLVLDTLDCNEDIAALPENTLCLATQTESIARAFSDDIIQRGYKDVLILYEESDGWMQFLERETGRLLNSKSVKVLSESSLPSTTDYKPSLLKAKNRGVSAIVFLGNDQMGSALKQARDLGITAQYYGIGSMASPGFQKLAGTSVEGALVSSWLGQEGSELSNFKTSFEKKFKAAPALELASIPAFDMAKILFAAMEKAKVSTNYNVAEIRREILATKNYTGLSGNLSFDSDGAVRSIHEKLYQIKKGQFSPYTGPRA